jgi:flagellar hook-basal body complex protein FliE
MNITSIQPVRPLDVAAGTGQTTTPASADFSSLLQAAYQRVEHSGAQASRMVDQFLSGESQDLHSVALAGQRATLQFEMLLQVRNKIVQAYQEVMRMQL